jgi:hypothetical protein
MPREIAVKILSSAFVQQSTALEPSSVANLSPKYIPSCHKDTHQEYKPLVHMTD